MTSFKVEFPDYPAGDLPTLPAGFVDQSWHNDACPSFVNEALKVQLYIDYLDPAMRECGPAINRFNISTTDDDYTHDVFSSNDWDEVLAFIASYKKEG